MHITQGFWLLPFSHNLAAQQLSGSSGHLMKPTALLPSADKTVTYQQKNHGDGSVNLHLIAAYK